MSVLDLIAAEMSLYIATSFFISLHQIDVSMTMKFLSVMLGLSIPLRKISKASFFNPLA